MFGLHLHKKDTCGGSNICLPSLLSREMVTTLNQVHSALLFPKALYEMPADSLFYPSGDVVNTISFLSNLSILPAAHPEASFKLCSFCVSSACKCIPCSIDSFPLDTSNILVAPLRIRAAQYLHCSTICLIGVYAVNLFA